MSEDLRFDDQVAVITGAGGGSDSYAEESVATEFTTGAGEM
jgi:hypothetical protein